MAIGAAGLSDAAATPAQAMQQLGLAPDPPESVTQAALARSAAAHSATPKVPMAAKAANQGSPASTPDASSTTSANPNPK